MTVNSNSYPAVFNGDGTWTLPAGTIATLPAGTYNVSVAATNAFSGVGTDARANALTVSTTQTVILGAGISKLTYTDADGTTVTVTAGKGQVAITLTGVGIALTGTGKARVVTATGGIRQIDINVQSNTQGLTFATNAAGDGLAAINSITGAGILTALNGKNVNLVGGIDMTGYIQSITLHAIESNIAMGTFAKGSSIGSPIASRTAPLMWASSRPSRPN